MKRIPPEFYAHSEQETFVYSDNPPGRFCLDHFLNGEAAWESEQLQTDQNKQQKILILHDWSFIVWDIVKIHEVIFKFKQLLNAGFKLYHYAFDEFQELTCHSVYVFLTQRYCEDQLHYTFEENEQVLAEAAVHFNLPSSSFYILDYHVINYLLLDPVESLGNYQAQEIVYLDDCSYILKVLCNFQRPKTKKLCVREKSKDPNLIQLEDYVKKQENISVYREVDRFVIDGSVDLLELWCYPDKKAIKSITIKNCSISRYEWLRYMNEFTSLEELIFEKTIVDSEEDNHPKFSKLKRLSYSVLEAGLHTIIQNSPMLKILEMKDLTLNDHFFSSLQTHSLTDITIEDSVNENNLKEFYHFLRKQTELVNLTLDEEFISYEQLATTLPASLKVLAYTNSVDEIIKESLTNYLHLFELKIISYGCSAESINGEERREITWYNEDKIVIGKFFLGERIIESNDNPPHPLEVLSIDTSSIDFFRNTLASYSGIKRLRLANLNNALDCGSLPTRNTMHLYFYNMNSEAILPFLIAAPKTISLTLKDSCLVIDRQNEKILPQLKRLILRQKSGVSVKAKLNWLDLKLLEIDNARIDQCSIDNIVAHAVSPVIIHTSPSLKVKQKKMDANTAYDLSNKVTYNVDRLFYTIKSAPDISIGHQRKEIYSDVILNPNACSQKNAFSLSRYVNLALVSRPIVVSEVDLYAKMIALNDADLAYSKQFFILNDSWLPIVSSSAQDEMLEYHIQEKSIFVEIQYSNVENLYYIKNKDKKDKGKRIALDFIFKRHLKKDAIKVNNELGEWLRKSEDFFSEFRINRLQLNASKPYTGKDYLNEMHKQKVGACRHRAILFYQLLKESFPNIPCRIIFNDLHAFVEIFIEDWVILDLGGYPAEIKINNDSPELEPSSENAKIDEYVNLLSRLRDSAPPINPLHFLQTVLNGFHQKILIECESSLNLSSLSLAIEKSCLEASLPVFYIHTPSDLNCRKPWIENRNNRGILHTEPGGLFYDFIHQQHQQSPIILINAENFKKADLVKFNTLLDKGRTINGFSIPHHAIIIVLNNINHPDCYKGSDLYSRFDKIYRNPFKNSLDQAFNLPWAPLNENERHLFTTINLFNGADWKRQLIGEWTLQDNHFIFKTGKLPAAIYSGKPLHIQNGPWHDPEFVFFCKQALMRGYIDIAGSKIRILANKNIAVSSGYTDLSLDIPVINEGYFRSGFILNALTAHRFFSNYDIDSSSKAFRMSPGIIEQHNGKTLHINLTHALPLDLFMRLLDACKNYRVTVHLYRLAAENNKFANVDVICTNNILTYIKDLTHLNKPLILDVSECHFSDLMIHTDVKLMQSHLEFSETEKALLLAIKNGQDVVLTGQFSQQLAETLAPLLLEQGCGFYGKSRIILVTTDAAHLTFLPIQTKLYPASEKALPKALQSIAPVMKNESTDEFIRNRYEQINKVLSKSPFAFIAGLTGVGKSQFIQEQFIDARSELYFGEEAMVNWAKDKFIKRKILVIDEANLSPRQWSEFNGLLYKPRGILIKGVFYPLKKRHKVIFIGNPASYGDRKMAPSFINENNVVVFDLMPLSYIRDKILNPLLPASAIAPLLEVYQKIGEQAKNEILISPRELRLIASLTLHAQQKNPAVNLDEVARYYAYTIGNLIIPELFPTPESFTRPNVIMPRAESKFLLTSSRLPIWQMLSDMLTQRHFNSGIGGLIIEGDSGIGKSELVKACLTALQFEIPFNYYFIPASMDLAEKEMLLLKAFHEGAVVVMEEINASSMMERLLNSLLMGQTLEGEKAKQSGFLLIGTQNPCYFGGRKKQSNALSRRLLAMHMQPYPKEEIQQILEYQGIESENARLISMAYDRLSPPPSLRELEKLAQMEVASSKKRKAELSSWASLFSAVGANDFIEGTAASPAFFPAPR